MTRLSGHGGRPVARHRASKALAAAFKGATLVGMLALATLVASIVNGAFGYVAVVNRVAPESLAVAGVPLENQAAATLGETLRANVSAGLLRRLENDKPLGERTRQEMLDLVRERVVRPRIVGSWTLFQSLFAGRNAKAEALAEHPDARFLFRSWLRPEMFSAPQSSDPIKAGLRTALLGTLWTIGITMLVAIPLGVGTAIWLEEYAGASPLKGVVQTNINNLAGVPSIVYGMLGLAVFVRLLGPLTSGAALGLADSAANGRTILSAGLTLALLVLPIVIINAQEAIKAVSRSLREAALALGATKWQTIRHHVLPLALPGILTGSILAISRATGETAPLVVVGASTFIALDPAGPFSKFTVLPIQIYQWTSRPQAEFQHLAAAAILVLLVLLLSLNSVAVWLRHRAGRNA